MQDGGGFLVGGQLKKLSLRLSERLMDKLMGGGAGFGYLLKEDVLKAARERKGKR